MYIYKVIIRNFRAIESLEWKPNKDINIIIGENGCGKSTIGTALDYLLNPYLNWYNRTLSEIDYYDRDMNKPILIEAWFKDVEGFVLDDGELFLEHVNEEGKISEDGKNLVLITRFRGNTDGSVSHVILANGKEHPFRQSHKGVLNYKYIESDRDPLKELSFLKNSTLSKVIDSDKLSDVIKDIIDSFNVLSTNALMDDPYFKSSIKRLEENFTDFNLIDNNDGSIGIEVTELTERKTLQSFSLVTKNKDTSNHIPLRYQSRGIKNLMLLTSLQEVMKTDGILYLEEPEQNLEPFMQRKIIKKLSSSNNGQMFFTTHSIEVAKVYEFENIFLMKNGKIKGIPNPKEVDEKFETHIERFYKGELLSGLFSKGVLLVEGDSEISGIPIFSQYCDKGLEYSGVEVFKGGGKDNVFKYASFYNKCGIPVISLVDNDSDINSLLDKYKKNNIESLVLKQPLDYETALITLESFQENWKELFEGIYPFKKYKDNYLRPFNSKDSKSEKLKDKYGLIKSDIKEIKTIEDIIDKLEGIEIHEYQREFLHLNLADIVNSKLVAVYLTGIADEGEEKYKSIIPVAFSNIFKIIGVFMNNGIVCDKTEKCVVNKIIDSEWESTDICYQCADIVEEYDNVLQIKDDSDEA
ncbi:AAA family ATPase [Tissierella sp.]|uniref:ATP-dependent nuclease n=1 Tax=Tissierella sp. TaxID=41274 RepID=UPI003058695A